MLEANGTKGAVSVPGSSEPSGRHELRFRFECDDVETFGARYAPDVSRGGIFIRTHELLPLASPVKLDLQFTNGTSFMVGEGLVFWLRQADQGGGQGDPGMGIRFTKMSPESHRNLTRILAAKEAEESLQEADDDGDFYDSHNECTVVASEQDLLAGAAAWPAQRAALGTPEEIADALASTAAVAMEAACVVTAPHQQVGETLEEQIEGHLEESQALAEAAGVATAPVVEEPAVVSPVADVAGARVIEAASSAMASGAVPVDAPVSPSQPLPVLPDWAFVSTRFAREDSLARGEGELGIPQYVGDDRSSVPDESTRGEISRELTSRPWSAPPVFAWRDRPSVGLILGAALVLVTALALAPRQKGARSGAPERARAAATYHVSSVRGETASAAPVAISAQAAPTNPTWRSAQ